MRRVSSAICGLILCAVLASSPLLLQPLCDETANRPIETNLPAEIDELSDPKVDERNEDKAHRVSGRDGWTPGSATLFLRPHLPQAERRDDPSGSLTHGLRAPPA